MVRQPLLAEGRSPSGQRPAGRCAGLTFRRLLPPPDGRAGLTDGSTSCHRAAPGGPAFCAGGVLAQAGEVDGGVQVTVEDDVAVVTPVGPVGQSELGFHRAAGRAGLPPFRAAPPRAPVRAVLAGGAPLHRPQPGQRGGQGARRAHPGHPSPAGGRHHQQVPHPGVHTHHRIRPVHPDVGRAPRLTPAGGTSGSASGGVVLGLAERCFDLVVLRAREGIDEGGCADAVDVPRRRGW